MTMRLNDAVRLHTARLDSLRQLNKLQHQQFVRKIYENGTIPNQWQILMQSMIVPMSEENNASGPGLLGASINEVKNAISVEHQALSGETVFVSESVMAVIASASQSMEPEPLFETDLLYQSGMLMFEVPLEVEDLHPITGMPDKRLVMPIRGIAWTVAENIQKRDGTIGKGIVMMPFTDHDGRVQFRRSMRLVSEEDGDSSYAPDEPPFRRGLVPTDFLPWAFGVEWVMAQSGEDAQYDYSTMTFKNMVSSVAQIRLFFLSLMRFAWQEIVKTRYEVVDRSVRRDAKRLLGDRDYGNGACVLRLRRETFVTERGGEGTPLRFRVVVRGHWRRQWYRSLGSVESPDSHRTIWIDPHIRGDENLPIRHREKVTSITR